MDTYDQNTSDPNGFYTIGDGNYIIDRHDQSSNVGWADGHVSNQLRPKQTLKKLPDLVDKILEPPRG